MSQFLITRIKEPFQFDVENIMLKPIEDDFLINVIEAISENRVFDQYFEIIDKNSKSSDKLFTEAQIQLQNGTKFEETRIFRIVKIAQNLDLRLIMWYSDYFHNLNIYRNHNDFLIYLENSIKDPLSEVYGIL